MDERNEKEDHQLSDMITFLMNWNDYLSKPSDGQANCKYINAKGTVAFNQIESVMHNLRVKQKKKEIW